MLSHLSVGPHSPVAILAIAGTPRDRSLNYSTDCNILGMTDKRKSRAVVPWIFNS